MLSVREGMKHVRDYVSQGNGPMVVEMSTYRYHGHSMSDPGTTYRNRDEIAAMRQTRDPIEFVKNLLLEHTDATEDELKAIEKDVRAEVAAACDRAKEPAVVDRRARGQHLPRRRGGKDVRRTSACPTTRRASAPRSFLPPSSRGPPVVN